MIKDTLTVLQNKQRNHFAEMLPQARFSSDPVLQYKYHRTRRDRERFVDDKRHSDCLNQICVCESLILIKEFISQFTVSKLILTELAVSS